MNSEELEDQLKLCVETVKSLLQPISKESLLISDLRLDSIDIVDLLFEIEQAFSIQTNIQELNELIRGEEMPLENSWDFTFAQLTRYVSEKLNKE